MFVEAIIVDREREKNAHFNIREGRLDNQTNGQMRPTSF